MASETDSLPLQETSLPADESELAAIVAGCFQDGTPVYPLGGGTSLDHGLPPSRKGQGVSLANLNQVVDFPARDLTITVQAGMTMSALAETLAPENLQLPINVPHPDKATIGGVIATNQNGPGRFGHGTIRDYVIGITAVDGTGRLFHGGGRVVKNVAGYDFCKLLTGSLGTLGVITQVTLKLKPIPASQVTLLVELEQLAQVEPTLAWLMQSAVQPTALQLFAGPSWNGLDQLRSPDKWHLAVNCCGTEEEVCWMRSELEREFEQHAIATPRRLEPSQHSELWQQLTAFPAATDAPLMIQGNMVPSGMTEFLSAAREVDPECSLQAHAGNGVVHIRFSEFPPAGLSTVLIGKLQPIAMAAHGNVTVLCNPSGNERTARSTWGSLHTPLSLLDRVKQAFDPGNILNPGRFVYS